MWYVCSDIHIGTAATKERYFYETLIPQIKNGDTLVLLGDIFDYWISSFHQGLDQLSSGWSRLNSQLKQLRTKGIDVIFVPGNHDSFVFYNEWSYTGNPPAWLDNLYRQGGPFAEVREVTTITHPLRDVATIHYPAFMRSFGDTNILFTHGHWAERTWPFITDDPSDPFINERKSGFLKVKEMWASVKANTLAFSYNHPDLMRRLFLSARRLGQLVPYFGPRLLNERGKGLGMREEERELDPFVDVRRTEDIIFTVASDVYQERAEFARMEDLMMEDPKAQRAYAQMLHGKLSDQLHELEKGTDAEIESRIRERGRNLIKKWTFENNPDREWVYALQRMMNILTRDIKVFSIEQRPAGTFQLAFDQSALVSALLSAIAGRKLPVLIHGHFHLPRRGSTVIDEGCMLNIRPGFDITTYIRIDAEGHIYGP